MDIGSILIGLAVVAVVVVYILQPILLREGQAVTAEDRRLSQLKADRDRTINMVKELDMDHAMKKIPESDYLEQRAELMTHGAAILREIDELGGLEETETPQDLDKEIEAAVSRLRDTQGDQTSKFCPACGEAVQAEDQFCTHCGAVLQKEAAR